jgi:hypothetical protein
MQAQTAAATWNIIRHYSGIPEETILSMEMLVDDPSNGMMLHADVHSVFDKLKVYFERNPEVSPADIRAIMSYLSVLQRENEYTLKEVAGRAWVHPRSLANKTITFRNHGAPYRNLPLPNPDFIALHAGLSRILHMSGAAEIFDQIFDRYDRASGGGAGLLKSNGDCVHQLSSMLSALHMVGGAPLIS